MVTCRHRNVMFLSPYSFFSRTYIHLVIHSVRFWSFFLKKKGVLRISYWFKKDHSSRANFVFSSGFVLVFQKRYCVCGTKKNKRKHAYMSFLINISFTKELLTQLFSRLVGALAWLRTRTAVWNHNLRYGGIFVITSKISRKFKQRLLLQTWRYVVPSCDFFYS